MTRPIVISPGIPNSLITHVPGLPEVLKGSQFPQGHEDVGAGEGCTIEGDR